MSYAPPGVYTLHRHGSNMSQEAGSSSQGLISANPGLVQDTVKSNGTARHQRWSDNPFVDQRWPFTPLLAEQNENAPHGHAPHSSYQRLPFDNRGESAVGSLARAGSNLPRMGSGLVRYGSGDQYVGSPHGQGMLRQGSSPGQFGQGMPFHSSGLPWTASGMKQQWAPMLTAADAAASAGSLVMHGPHSLLERPGQGD